MDTSEQYHVVFSGRIRDGFERPTVMQTLAGKLRLNAAQAQRLFAGDRKHVLKRTSSEEEAWRYVTLLARLGAVAAIEPGAGGGSSAEGLQTAPRENDTKLSNYSPAKLKFLARPLLYLAGAFEGLFTLAYAALLLGVATGTFYYSLFTYWAASIVPQPLLALVFQILCFFLGLIALVLLAKPLLSVPHLRHQGIVLPPGQEPDLNMFVEDLCERHNLPLPREIHLNNDIAVRFRHYRGPVGFLKGESILTIGAPLLAATTTSQLAALIAQAAFLFRPSIAPRAAFLVLSSNQWLHQAAYGEDFIDRMLQRWDSAPTRMLIKAFDFSRTLMRKRLAISRVLEKRLVHRLVADADKQALALAGSKAFGQMMGQQLQLHHATTALVPKLQQQWNETGKLPEDLIPLILRQARAYPASVHRQLYRQQEQEKTKSADIIPSHAQRLRSLQGQSVMAELENLAPANTLLRYFSKLARTMTLRFYHNRMKLTVSPDKLIHIIPKDSTEFRVNKSIDSFFNRLWSPQVPLQLSALLQDLQSAEDARAQWRKAAALLKQDHGQAQAVYRQFRENEKQVLDDTIREQMYRAEMWRELGEKKPRKDELEEFHQECRDNEHAYDESLHKLRQHTKPYALRLAAALAMLKFAPYYSNAGAIFKEAERLIGIYGRIESTLAQRHELKQHTAILQLLLNNPRRKKQNIQDLIEENSSDIRQKLITIRASLKGIDNPYPTQRGGKKVMDYLLLEAYTDDSPEGDYDRGNDVVHKLEFLQKRILAQLIAIAQKAIKTYS